MLGGMKGQVNESRGFPSAYLLTKSATLAQWIAGLTWQTTVHSHDLRAGLHVLTVNECDRAWDSCYQLVGHVVRVHHLGRCGCFRPENFRNPILFKLRFGHLVNDFQNYVPLPGHWGSNEQDDRNVGAPVLAIAEKNFANVRQAQIADRRV